MERYCTVARSLFAVVFIGGGVWQSFVMPNIGWLTLVLAVFQIAAGVLLLLDRDRVRIAAIAILTFFSFILLLGYGFSAANLAEDPAKNRAFTVVMAALLIPVLAQPDPPGIVTSWRRLSGAQQALGRRTMRRSN